VLAHVRASLAVLVRELGPARASVPANSSICKLASPADEAKGLLGDCAEGVGVGGVLADGTAYRG
jgi:hypothetical protein